MLPADKLHALANILANKDPQMLLGHVEAEISTIEERAEKTISDFIASVGSQLAADKSELMELKDALLAEFTDAPPATSTDIPVNVIHTASTDGTSAPTPDNGFNGL